jgi:hypothetical protein
LKAAFWQSREQYSAVWHLGQGLRGFSSGSVSGLEQCAHFLRGEFNDEAEAEADSDVDEEASGCCGSVRLSDICTNQQLHEERYHL